MSLVSLNVQQTSVYLNMNPQRPSALFVNAKFQKTRFYFGRKYSKAQLKLLSLRGKNSLFFSLWSDF